MEATKCMHRPAYIVDKGDLDAEYRAAQWMYHRLLDFEKRHQALLDGAAELAAPGITRVGKIISRLHKRDRRAVRSSEGQWKPKPRPKLLAELERRKEKLRKQRDADPRWKEAIRIADQADPCGDFRDPPRQKRSKGETDAQFAERCANRRDRRSYREQYRIWIYRQRRIHWATFNALVKSVNQARQMVVKRRSQGMPADLRRPKWDSPITITADKGSFRIVERGDLWWTIEMRLLHGHVRFRAKFGNWHDIPEGATFRQCQLTRRKDGRSWKHTVSVTVAGMGSSFDFFDTGTVALDWGHREYGHDRANEGMRVMTWLGDDGATGEVILPRECRELLDQVYEARARVDQVFEARRKRLDLRIPVRRSNGEVAKHNGEIIMRRVYNRHRYRAAIHPWGVRSQEEADWFRWEARYERRLARMWKRIKNLRNEAYLRAVQELRTRYKTFVFEDEKIAGSKGHRSLDIEEMTRRRKRQNRELSARYEFISIVERYGGRVIKVPARDSTRECPDCGNLDENNADLMIACSGCGRVRDKDYGAARVILARAQGPFADAAE